MKILRQLRFTIFIISFVIILVGCADELFRTLEQLYIVDNPTFDPPPGNYGTDISIILASTTPGTDIWFTTDGSEPFPGAAGSTLYSGPIDVKPVAESGYEGSPLRLFVKAYKDGMTPSDEIIGPFNVQYSGPSAPVLRVVPTGAAIYDSANSTWNGEVEIFSDGDPANINAGNQWIIDGRIPRVHYTIDGTIPDGLSPSVDNSVGNLIATLSSDGDDVTFNALTVVGGDYPDSLSANVRVRIYYTDRVVNPVFTTVAGDPISEVCYVETTVRCDTVTPGASIDLEYELNGDGIWTALGSGPAPLDVSIFPPGWNPVSGDVVTLRALATGAVGQGDSEEVTAAFVFLEGSIEKPTILPASGTYSGTTTMTITSDFAGADLYYTLDGSYPDPIPINSYSGSVDLVPGTTYYVNALAEFAGVESAVSSAVIEVTL